MASSFQQNLEQRWTFCDGRAHVDMYVITYYIKYVITYKECVDMKAIKVMDLRDNLKKYCDQAVAGETLVIARKDNKNVVMISEDDYNRMAKAMRNAEYLAKLEHSFNQLDAGHVVTKSIEELKAMEG